MIQLQSRINPFIYELDYDTRPWQVDDEATIVTRDMRRCVNQLNTEVAGYRAYRIVDTKKQPELAIK
jgi:hypothetical protein